jgi:hypothetical protein
MERKTYNPPTVVEAKKNLRKTSANIEYFSAIKKYPLKSTGAAFLAGILWGRLKKDSNLPPGLLEIALQLIKRL